MDAHPDNWIILDPNKSRHSTRRTWSSSAAPPPAATTTTPEEIAAWNSITTPMMNMTPYLVRGTLEAGQQHHDLQHRAADDRGGSDHPVFDGVELDPNGLAVLDTTVGTGNTSFLRTLDMGNGS